VHKVIGNFYVNGDFSLVRTCLCYGPGAHVVLWSCW
jgi:hypothetical protein